MSYSGTFGRSSSSKIIHLKRRLRKQQDKNEEQEMRLMAIDELNNNQDIVIQDIQDQIAGGLGMSQVEGDARYYRKIVTLDQILKPVDVVDMNAKRLTNLAAVPTGTSDAATVGYVNTQVGNRLTQTVADTLYGSKTIVDGLQVDVQEIDGRLTAVEERAETNHVDIQALQDRVLILEQALWMQQTRIHFPLFTTSASVYLNDLVKGTDYWGYGTGNIQHVALSVQGTLKYMCFLLTIPDPGFDVQPDFMLELLSQTNTSPVYMPLILHPHVVPSVTIRNPGLGVTNISRANATTNWRTTFLICVKSDTEVPFQRLHITWRKKLY